MSRGAVETDEEEGEEGEEGESAEGDATAETPAAE